MLHQVRYKDTAGKRWRSTRKSGNNLYDIGRALAGVLIIWSIACSAALAQNLENINKALDVKFSGGVNLTTLHYGVQGIENRTSPFSWALSGTPSIQIGDFRFPFHFSFRDQRFGYGTPFNKFGVSPYYKWIKLHLGWRTMNFSPYSLQGKSFLGVGIELKPGDFRFSAFKGTLRNPFAQLDTLVYGAYLVDSYRRQAHGVKVGFGSTRHHFDLFYVKIKDDITTIGGQPEIADYELDPADNFVVGTSVKVTTFKRFEWMTNLNISAYSDNQTLGEILFDQRFLRFINDLFVFNSSTQLSLAGDAGLTCQFDNLRLGIKYRRVEPQYRSLGISYIQSDVESVLASMQMTLLKRKLMFSARAGIERTDLRGLDYLGRRRLIRDAQLQWVPNKFIQVMGQMSNFQYETQDGLIELNDTLRIVNVTRQSGLFVHLTRPAEIWQSGLSFSVQQQTIVDQSPVFSFGTDIRSVQTNLTIKLNYLPADFRVSPSVFYTRYHLPDRLQERYGIGLSLQKGFFEKALTVGLSGRWSRNDIDQFRNGHILSIRANGSYQMKSRHTLSATISILDKSSILSPSFSESRTSLSYGYRF